MSRTCVLARWLNHSVSGGRGGYAFLLDTQIQLTSLLCVCWGEGGGGGGERRGFVFAQFRLALIIFFHYEDARYQLNFKNAIFGSLR